MAATVFCGVFVQALPFLALGVVVSGLIAAFISADRLARWLPRRPAVAEAAGYPEDTWLQLEGEVVPGTSVASPNFVPTFAVSRVARIDKPANTYAY